MNVSTDLTAIFAGGVSFTSSISRRGKPMQRRGEDIEADDPRNRSILAQTERSTLKAIPVHACV